jgi:hypothetical protein
LHTTLPTHFNTTLPRVACACQIIWQGFANRLAGACQRFACDGQAFANGVAKHYVKHLPIVCLRLPSAFANSFPATAKYLPIANGLLETANNLPMFACGGQAFANGLPAMAMHFANGLPVTAKHLPTASYGLAFATVCLRQPSICQRFACDSVTAKHCQRFVCQRFVCL